MHNNMEVKNVEQYFYFYIINLIEIKLIEDI